MTVLCVVGLLLGGCDGEDNDQKPRAEVATSDRTEQTAPETPAPSPADRTDGPVPSSTEGAEIAARNDEAVSADTLKALLPASVPAMERTNASAERNQMMGVDLAIAEATYESAGGGSMTVTLTDAGSMTGPMRLGLAGWAAVEYDRKTDAGYEKTTTYGEYKAMEEYDSRQESGSIRVFVAERFLVEIEGYGVSMETLKQALEKVDLKKVAHLASAT